MPKPACAFRYDTNLIPLLHLSTESRRFRAGGRCIAISSPPVVTQPEATMRANFLLRKLPRRLGRVLYERFPEPLHLNLLSIFVMLFGSYKTKIAFDLVVRQQYAFSLLKTAELAQAQGLKSVTVIEFGVAAGAGLMNICNISRKITKITGVDFQIFGFDSGHGMPPPRDHRDHPEVFSE